MYSYSSLDKIAILHLVSVEGRQCAKPRLRISVHALTFELTTQRAEVIFLMRKHAPKIMKSSVSYNFRKH